jgi:hypothetical protein
MTRPEDSLTNEFEARPGYLHDYYWEKGFSPTFGSFQTQADLDRHAALRARIFSERLQLPPRLFRDARVVEFGPDSGENALVFAQWGARLELLEPNMKVWPLLRRYFERFGLSKQLTSLTASTIQEYKGGEPADFVVAEGFIHTVKPESAWIRVVQEIVAPGGFLILFYYERTSILVELLQAAAYQEAVRLSDHRGAETARRLYGAKWDSIPHTRPFESWMKDVLENPYTGTRFTLDATRLVADLAAAGFCLHQSWPRYRNELRMAWHKTPESFDDVVREVSEHLPRVALAYALGVSLFSVGSEADIAAIRALLDRLLLAGDAALAIGGAGTWRALAADLASLGAIVGDASRVFAPPEARSRATEVTKALSMLCAHLGRGDLDSAAAFASSDPVFIRTWGQPAHLGVFRRLAG